MNLPNSIPNSIECPACSNGIAKLEWQLSLSGYDYLVYNCSFCKECWTTNETDELSIKSHNIKKRSELRKLKIKKL